MQRMQKQAKMRDQNKVFFFGLVSSGKSTIINAILKEDVSPMGTGATTNCCCCVTGNDEAEAYLCTPGSLDRQNIEVTMIKLCL